MTKKTSSLRKNRIAHQCAIHFQKPTLAKQSFKDECDINQIMKKFEKDGVLIHLNEFQGSYGDFAQHPQYHDAMNTIADANSMFETIPAGIRAKFHNSPEEFLEFAQNPDNKKALVKMGLAHPPKSTENPVDKQREVVPPTIKKEASKEAPEPTNKEGQDTL